MKCSIVRSLCGLLALRSMCSRGQRFTSSTSANTMLKLTGDQMAKLQSQVGALHNGDNVMKCMIRWTFGNSVCGYLTPSFAKHLEEYPEVFAFNKGDNTVTFHNSLQKVHETARSKEIARINNELRAKGVIKGWRDELFPVSDSFCSSPIALIERASVPHYGVQAYGVHVNGFIRHPQSGQITHLWAGKRASTKSTYPGMLDHIVAGGIPYGISVAENVIKECSEEASIPEELARTATQTANSISYNYADSEGNLKRDELFCFDLELPADFVPVPQDGEVESFHLFDVQTVLEKVLAGGSRGFKPNCSLVIIDFLLRHSIISPESPRYAELVASVRSEQRTSN